MALKPRAVYSRMGEEIMRLAHLRLKCYLKQVGILLKSFLEGVSHHLVVTASAGIVKEDF